MVVIAFFIGLIIPAWAGSPCLPYVGHCEYYLCMNAHHPCRNGNYLKDFGYKYCERFQSDKFLLKQAPETKRWLEEVRVCLMRSIENIEAPNSTARSCFRFRMNAIDSHSNCYIDTGYCELSRRDRRDIANQVAGRLYDLALITEAFEILNQCAEKKRLQK